MPNTAKKPGKNDIRTFIKSASDRDATVILGYLNIQDEATHDRAIQLAGDLMDEIGDVPEHPIHMFMDLLADAIGHYENKIYPPMESDPIGVLKYLMDAQGVKQADLADIFGSQGNVSQILNGQRGLKNLDHIRKLAERLHVDPAVFL